MLVDFYLNAWVLSEHPAGFLGSGPGGFQVWATSQHALLLAIEMHYKLGNVPKLPETQFNLKAGK